MVRKIFGIFFLLVTLLFIVLGITKVIPGKENSDDMPTEVIFIAVAIYGALGCGLYWWGSRAITKKKVLTGLTNAFSETKEADFLSLIDNSEASTVLGIPLTDGEEIVASLIPDNMEKLYYQRGQVAAVTNRRLLFVLPRRAGISKRLEDHYTIESVSLEQVRAVTFKKSFAVGGLCVGIILMGIAAYHAIGGITGYLIGPGVVYVPLITAPLGLSLVFGIRRRVITFTTPHGNFRWRSGPMEVKKTKSAMLKVKELFDSRRITVAETRDGPNPVQGA